ncbi:carbonic anhydrase [Methanogenium sp. S4BF]|uniref:carbonic anhydrase n=1 Tax=Methanogenium sp. S4BF TaxID=1789226 RepID=UPI002416B82C|nr:carbonic anhydrase [Methanogenium sp. S4BF]WFN33847.1 carbonic anhydrase [Methanogenium sp. S4BF]
MTNPSETGGQATEDTKSGSATGTGAKTPLIEQLLEGNQAFRDNEFRDNPERYRELAVAQSPGVLWIGCSDSRAAPERITSAPPGELFVTRNVGNIVPTHDWSLSAVVEYSISHLKVQEIVVVGHSDCGAVKALDKDLQDPYIPLWLNDAREAKARVDARIPKAESPEELKERTHQIELENVRLQIEHLMTYPSVRQAVDEGRIEVHGLYYDLTTGTLSRVV